MEKINIDQAKANEAYYPANDRLIDAAIGAKDEYLSDTGEYADTILFPNSYRPFIGIDKLEIMGMRVFFDDRFKRVMALRWRNSDGT